MNGPGPMSPQAFIGPIAAPRGGAFVTRWDTTLNAAGTASDSRSIQLPLQSDGQYNFFVDWGDGTTSQISRWDAADALHTYAAPGQYNVLMTGVLDGWAFSGGGDREKLLEIAHWGPLGLGDSGGYFDGCTHLQVTADDAPNLTGTSSLNAAFRGCQQLDADFSRWDVSSITSMNAMFDGCIAFNHDLAPQPRRAVFIHTNNVHASGPDIGNGDAVTVAFRIRKNDTNQGHTLSKGTAGSWQWTVRFVGYTQLRVFQHNNDGSHARALTFGSIDIRDWTDVVITMTDSAIRADVGGVTASVSDPFSGAWNTSGGVLRLGARKGAPDADIAYVRDVVIAETDLWSQRATLLDDPSAALAHYPLEEAGGRRAFNRLANANHLTWTNAELSRLHVIDREVGRSWANESGYTKALRIAASGIGTSYSADNTWISARPASGDFRVDWYLEELASGCTFGLRSSKSPAVNNQTSLNYGVQWTAANELTVWENGSSSVLLATVASGDVVFFRRSAGTVALYLNDAAVHSFSAVNETDLFPAASFASTATPGLVLVSLDREPIGSGEVGANLQTAPVVIPRVEGDAINALGHTAQYPIGDLTPRFNPEAVQDFETMFAGCSSMRGDLSGWDTTSAIDMARMFDAAASFDQPLTWQIPLVNDMTDFAAGTALSPENYAVFLASLAAQTLQPGVPLSVGATQYPATAAADRQQIIDAYTWTITDGGPL